MRTNPILVVDDDDALREALVEALEVLPVEITVAAGGKEAVEMLAERRFAVIVTDLVMKGTDGFAVLQSAKETYPNCRVVMLTGHGGREIAVQAMEQGATYYVEKPVDLADLRAKVKKSLEDHDKDVAYDDLKGQMERAYGIEGDVTRKFDSFLELPERQAMLAKWQSRVLTCPLPISALSFSPLRMAFTKLVKCKMSLAGWLLVSTSLPARSWMMYLFPVVMVRVPLSP